eukprot:3683172-Pyramimonas_sp.AAC.1
MANVSDKEKATLVDELMSNFKDLGLQLPPTAGVAKLSILLSRAKGGLVLVWRSVVGLPGSGGLDSGAGDGMGELNQSAEEGAPGVGLGSIAYGSTGWLPV